MEYCVWYKNSDTCSSLVTSFDNPQDATKLAAKNDKYYIRCFNYD